MEREREREIETSIFKILIQTRNLIPLDIPIYIYRSTLVDLVVKYGANISTPFRLLVVNPDPGLFSFSFHSGENEIPPPSMTFRRKESDHPLPTIPFPSSSHFSSPIRFTTPILPKFRSLLFSRHWVPRPPRDKFYFRSNLRPSGIYGFISRLHSRWRRAVSTVDRGRREQRTEGRMEDSRG